MTTTPSVTTIDLRALAGRPTVTVEEAGRLVGLSRGSAYLAVRTGEMPSVRLGHRIFVPTAALLRDVLGLPPEAVMQALGLVDQSA